MAIILKNVLEFGFCIIDNIILYKFVSLFIEEKKKNNTLILVTISICVHIIGVVEPMSIYSTVINLLFIISLVFLCFKSNNKNKIIISIIFYIILGIYTIITSFLWQFLTKSIIAISNPEVILTSRYLYIIITKSVILVFMWIAPSKTKNKLKENIIDLKFVSITLVSSLCIVFLLAEFIVYQNISSIDTYIVLIFGLITVIASLVIITKYYEAKINISKLDYEKNIMKEHNKQLFKELEADQKIYKIKHDMNNLYIVWNELLRQKKYDELEKCFNEVISEHLLCKRVNTMNSIINSILNHKIAINDKIKFITKMDITNDSFDKIDIAILLGNALDNAVEACAKSNEKIIKIYIKESENQFLIHIKNSYNGQLESKDGSLLSSKRNYLNKGLGFNNMEDVVRKYGGKMKINFDESYFELNIVIIK